MTPPIIRFRIATVLLVGALLLSGAIAAAWFAGQGTISLIFQQLDVLQNHPPMWLAAPMRVGHYLLFWAVLLMLVVFFITKISPQPQPWSRSLVVGILLVLTVRYLIWRSLSTLNLSTPLNGVFSIGLFLLELLLLVSSIVQLILLFRVRDRRAEADQLAADVHVGGFMPTVDILIPTYNEPEFILRRTVIGCQAVDYPHKTVYLLDDTRRPEIEALAAELGCQYRTRPDNRHAKAGNLNHAISQTQGELLVVFDADFIPTQNFLSRTVGFFQDPQVALVQTPQTFYNPDPVARNLGLEDVLTPEEEVFYRQIQPFRDAAGGVICAGTSFVVRRSALVEIGCFFTESLSEDYFTGIRLAAQGYRLVYLNEKLSAGLAAENVAALALQRLRWAQGTLQAFFITANPLTIRGLRPLQRLAHLEGLLHWFTSISRLGFLLMPLAYAFLGVIPIRSTVDEALYYFLPWYLVQITATSWLNHRARSALLADIYSLILCFPLALTVLQVMLNPFGRGFSVTPKGGTSDRFTFNGALAWPLLVMFGASALSLWLNLGVYMMNGMGQPNIPQEIAERLKGLDLGLLWSFYNLLMLSVSLLILIDVPRLSAYEWFKLRRTVKLRMGEQDIWGVTSIISEVGMHVVLTQPHLGQLPAADTTAAIALPVQVSLMEEGLTLSGKIIDSGWQGEFRAVQITFDALDLSQHRQLVQLLFCRPGQWKSRCAPGELRSLWLLLRILLRPRIVFGRKPEVSAIAVTQS
ncbi:MAG: glycosyltransferase [Oscillatoriophycideae cyanobacterium NC_groundwater_1537_Pr4_S-0.65um_50_18]|nr:glycosyltransferase [Oscillatoriophycideae cyanobacterium NC_groundwater_1537_Pr4_S-0.65um_50_18]